MGRFGYSARVRFGYSHLPEAGGNETPSKVTMGALRGRRVTASQPAASNLSSVDFFRLRGTPHLPINSLPQENVKLFALKAKCSSNTQTSASPRPTVLLTSVSLSKRHPNEGLALSALDGGRRLELGYPLLGPIVHHANLSLARGVVAAKP